MWGDKDPAVYVSSMEPLARHFANVQKIVFPGVGHLPYEECAQEFNRALIEFLTNNDSKSPVRQAQGRLYPKVAEKGGVPEASQNHNYS